MEVDVEALKVAHQLIMELHQVCDGVLLSVIPQLEAELKVSTRVSSIAYNL